ncbi:MAG: tetratricopeptide repeat protein [Candidatus Pacebacteria bacterium]|nr:tetratricopeptide repeat protein [Candidatus Paceibacterota bacterium]
MIIIIPLILIFLSLVAIGIIIARKFPVLSLLDVKSMPEEKEAKFKEEIMKQRFDRALQSVASKLGFVFKKPSQGINNFSKKINANLKQKKEKYQAQKRLSFEKRQKKVSRILEEVSDLINIGEYDKAEEKAISILTFDSHNQFAFEKLGEIYLLTRKHQEAKETHLFLLKLFEEKDQLNEQANTYYTLSEVAQAQGALEEAVDYLRQALEIHKNQPRYLNKLLELLIALKNETEAKEVYQLLASVNPENNKLLEWREKIEKLSVDKEN